MKNYLLLLLLWVPSLAAAQTPISFVLKGRLGSATYRAAPTYVYLRYGRVVDSAVVAKGRFELKGTVDEPTKAWLSMRRHHEDMSDYKAVFFLEQGTLVFTSPDSLKNAQVGGTPLAYEMTLEPNRLPLLPLLEATPAGDADAPRTDGLRAFLRSDLQWQTERAVTERLRLTARAYLEHRHGPQRSRRRGSGLPR